MGKIGGNLFLREQEVFISLHFFDIITKPCIYSNFSTGSHQFLFSTVTKITCSFSFNQLLAVSSPHCNFDFSQNPILRLYHSSPFAPVQSLKAVLDTESYNFYKKYACVELWTVPRESRGPRPSVCFWLLFAEAKSNVKRLWDILGAWGTPQKVTQKPSL